MNCTAVFIAILVVSSSGLTARARYLQPEIQKIPTDRLITNLQARVTAEPKNLEVRYQLGRVHSIAYATRDNEFAVLVKGGQPFFGVGTRKDYPPEALSGGARDKSAAAQAHLKQSIAHYRVVTAADTNHHFAFLGLGWSLDQAGDRDGALAAYRQAFLLGWRLEEQSLGIEVGGCITDEVARYLLQLLDPVRDADEIKLVNARVKSLEKKGRWITPILIPLADNVALAELVDPRAGVPFDLDGSGLRRSWGWITPRAAWLVHDPDGQGEITSGLQLFGNVTFWTFWSNGYQALAALDDNRDGLLRGAELNGLALWQDCNSNGVSDPGEVRSLAERGIIGLSCQHEPHPDNLPFSPRGVVFQNGSTRPSYDWMVPGR